MIQLAVVAYCVLACRDLITAWTRSPFDQGGDLVFVLWLTPLFVTLLRAQARFRTVPLAVGVGLSLLGTLGQVNAVQHVGLIVVIAGLLPLSWPQSAWMLAGLAWMPALGWVLSRLVDAEMALAVRWGLMLPPTLWLLSTMITLPREGEPSCPDETESTSLPASSSR